ncbi:MAG: hypothetical protein ACYS26_18905, partial [Planctomycetota bacterium]
MLRRCLWMGVLGTQLGVASSAWAATPKLQDGADSPSSAQVGELEPKRLVLRVIEVRAGGLVVVDRGASDGLQAEATVTFTPRGGAPVAGRVLSVDPRTAVVELTGANDLPSGTRGETWVQPSEAPPAPEPAAPVATEEQQSDEVSEAEAEAEAEAETGGDGQLPAHPGWTKDEWTPDQPLLTQMAEVRPEDRPWSMRGSLSFLSQRIYTNEDDREDAFDAIGLNVIADNPFGWGGRMQFDGAWTDRETITPDDQGEEDTLVRLDRLSYATGGTRFDQDRLEFGRFLQSGMPEFGLLDGIEWGH